MPRPRAQRQRPVCGKLRNAAIWPLLAGFGQIARRCLEWIRGQKLKLGLGPQSCARSRRKPS